MDLGYMILLEGKAALHPLQAPLEARSAYSLGIGPTRNGSDNNKCLSLKNQSCAWWRATNNMIPFEWIIFPVFLSARINYLYWFSACIKLILVMYSARIRMEHASK
jgi:hypothetical protein